MLVEFQRYSKPFDEEKVSSWFSCTPNFLTQDTAEKLKKQIIDRYDDVKCFISANDDLKTKCKWVIVEFYSEADEATFLFDVNSGIFIV